MPVFILQNVVYVKFWSWRPHNPSKESFNFMQTIHEKYFKCTYENCTHPNKSSYMYSLLIHGIKNEGFAKFLFEWKNINLCVGLSLCLTYTIYEVMKTTNHHSYSLNDAISEMYQVYAPRGRCAPDSMCPMVESCSPCVESLCPNHAALRHKGNQGADISFKWVKPSVIGLKHSNSMKFWHPGTLLPNIDIVEMSFLSVNLVRHIKSVHEWLKVILNFCSDISNVHMW